MRVRAHPVRSRAGFTLIEVLVTTVVLATGVVLVLRAFDLGAVALGLARDRLWSTMLVHEKVDEIRAAVADGEARSIPPFTAGRLAGRFSEFRWESRFEAEPVDARAPADESEDAAALWRVTVTVWRDRSERRISAATLLVVRGRDG